MMVDHCDGHFISSFHSYSLTLRAQTLGLEDFNTLFWSIVLSLRSLDMLMEVESCGEAVVLGLTIRWLQQSRRTEHGRRSLR